MSLNAKSIKSKNLIVIVGPTAIGKTALSIEIAKKFNCEKLTADTLTNTHLTLQTKAKV